MLKFYIIYGVSYKNEMLLKDKKVFYYFFLYNIGINEVCELLGI